MRAPVPLLFAAAALAACNGNSSGLRGAGSMLVEVELYKGPLAQSAAIQIGELQSVLEETARAMSEWTAAAKRYHSRSGCSPGSANLDCHALNEVIENGQEVIDDVCAVSPVLTIRDYQYIGGDGDGRFQDTCRGTEYKWPSLSVTIGQTGGATRLDALPSIPDIRTKQSELARRISAIAGNMKSKSFRIADGLISYVPSDRSVRTFIANFSLITAEYANQIQARIGVLDKQLAGQGRKTLSVGQYLRDASPTDFVHLFDWFGATYGDQAIAAPGQLGIADRIRMAERLFADYYWEKINEVYTSGQGDVSMAFIKNDIGNWDLKSFSNDPAELLEAYRGAADAAISAIVELVGTATPAGGAIEASEQLLDLGNRIASGQSRLQPDLGVLDAGALHARTLAKLVAKQREFAAREAELVEAAAATKSAAEATGGSADGPARALTTRQAGLEQADAALAACRASVPADTQTPPCASEVQAQAAAANALKQAEAEKAAAETELAEKKVAAAEADAALVAVRKAAQQSIREILDDHLALIAALQEAVAGAAPAEPTVVPTPTVPVGATPGVLPATPIALPSLPGS